MEPAPVQAINAHDVRPRSTRALIVDDNQELRELLGGYLSRFNIDSQAVGDGQGMRQALAQGHFDVIILDLMLPGEDGLVLCRELRSQSDIPILMLTARCEPTDRIIGLELGADDYLPKPFEPRELLARIRAVLRRRGEPGGSAATTRSSPVLRFGSLEIDRDARTVQVAGQLCELTSYQFDLLVAMAERAGRVLTRDQIMEAVRGRELEAFDRSIDVHIGRIRTAIEVDSKDPKRILTVRGVGYVFAKQQE